MPATKHHNESAPSLPSVPTCLALQKFSSAIVPRNSVGPLPWTHLSSQGNLFAIFDTVRTVRSDGSTTDSKRFKILQDPDILEDIDLDLLASESRRAIDMARDASDHNKDHNVAVIKKVPVIAVKYPMSGGQVKRFQIRFREDPDFYEALKQMSNIGVHMLEAGTFPSNRPQDVKQASVQLSHAIQPPSYMAIRSATPIISALNHSTSKHGSAVEGSMLPPPCPNPMKVNASDLQYFQKQMMDQSHARPSLASISAHDPTINQDGEPRVDVSIYGLLGDKPAAIDTYVPRPSTAPAQVSQHLSQLLPPPRELPFKCTTTAGKRQRLDDTGKPGQLVIAPNTEGCVKEIITHVPDSQEAPETLCSVKRPKRGVKNSSSTGPVTSRKKRTAAFKCDACKAKGPRTRCRHKEVTPPLPSIEELFDVDFPPAHDRQHSVKQIDTQNLLDRFAATKQRKAAPETASKLADLISASRITRSMSAAARDLNQDRALDNGAMGAPHGSPNVLVDQIAHRVPNAATPEPATNATDTSMQPPMKALVDVARIPAIVPARQEEFQRSFASVMAHPSFIDVEDRLESFASLTQQQQADRLRSFVLSHTSNKYFKKMCEVMETGLSASLGVGLWSSI